MMSLGIRLGLNLNQDCVMLAVFHKLGANLRFKRDATLHQFIGEVAKDYPNVLGEYQIHPQYGYSKHLSELISSCVLCGSLISEGVTETLRVAPHLANAYGAKIYDDLDESVKQVVNKLAATISAYYSKAGD